MHYISAYGISFEGQTIILKGVTHLWVLRCWSRVPFDDTF